MLRLQQQVKAADETLSQLRRERQEIEHRAQLMRPGSLDPDLLEEKSRELLDYSKPNEIVVLTPGNNLPSKDGLGGQGLLQRNK